MIGWLRQAFPVLFKDSMPVWMTLALAVAAALATGVGTYILAPVINENIDLNKTRSSRVSSSIDDLNKSIVTLSVQIRRFNSSLDEKTSSAKLREEALDRITELQWKIVDLRVILTDADDEVLLKKLGSDLTGLKAALESARSPKDQRNVLFHMRQVSGTLTKVLDRLYVAARLKDKSKLEGIGNTT